ncbi:BamA/TamA family outer membrane protein [Chitinophagaceae bacterium LB-8]|uniref:BamA/TamA family outer membrane protein n=1 Tax=Paraflavisolibacter caeni TaxID=2982496 RepID=A0A9X2XYE4_9BACT|nr:BamA/TamA family outer membrane protein [Paraflavisolibacter caeni]MCU7551696.1 BamA/TamA family outer membrane protein [Paraflavisolibacter caeni]
MKRFNVLLFAFLLSTLCFAQADTIQHRIYFIGDAGELYNNGHPVVDWLKKNVDWDDERNTAVFLGDNIYPLGMPSEHESGYSEAKAVIDHLISLVKGKKAKAYFVMGNHDWKNGKEGGWYQAMNQINYINSLGLSNIQAWPTDGCPGPIEVELSDKVVIALMDSQWFLHVHEKPGTGSTCDAKTVDQFSVQLREIANSHPNQLLIVAMHHPLRSYGVHGGAYALKHHIFPLAEAVPGLYIPLPIIGSIYPVARGLFGTIQDVNHPIYRSMANEIEAAIRKHPNVVTVAGHDHSLQMLIHDSIQQIVSGAGAVLTRLKEPHNKEVLFSEVSRGFAMLEVSKNGTVNAKFYTVNFSKDLSTPKFTTQLKSIVPVVPKPHLDTLLPLKDYVVVQGDSTLQGNGLKYLFQGRNYRKEWTQPIKTPVLDLGKEMGGMKPIRQGGGKQTKSLRMEDASGKEWALRSIMKFPEAAIPADLRQTFAKDIVEDGISASYPYASLSVGPLAEAAGVPVIRRKLVYVPEDPRLERFRDVFGNTMAILEEREPVGVKKTDNTSEMVLKLIKDNDNHVDQAKVLKARLLDNFIMDFDRHEDQWRWATYDTGKGKVYYPIPRDHDQAFFVNQGLLPFYARKPWFLPEIQGFKAKATNIKTFNRPARNFDRFFMNELSADDWQKQLDTFLMKMTDDVITTSLMRQPKEIQQFSANKIIQTLKEKRDHYFRRDMMKYYDFISKEVNILGSNDRELFTITRNNDGTVHVQSNKITKSGEVTSKIYERQFDPKVTKEVRIFGMEDDDSFIVNGGFSPIKIRIIGGPGNDHFINNSERKKVLAYDATYEQNTFTGNFHDKTSSNPQVNQYERFQYKYRFINPGVSVEYNADDGVFIGAQLEYTKQHFRKNPFSARHFIRVTRALATTSTRIKYEGDFTKLLGKYDLIVRADLKAPTNVTNFFGLGNETEYDKSKPGGIDYYRTRYNIGNVSVMMHKQLQSWMHFSLGPAFQYFTLDSLDNQDKLVSTPDAHVGDRSTLYENKYLLGAEARLHIDSRLIGKVIPTRGAVMDFYARPLFGMNGKTNNVVQTQADISIYMSLAPYQRLVLATRIGGGYTFGDFEFPQAQYLSNRDNLRGYRKDRFAGRSMLYNNLELRWKIADFNTYLFPGSIGLLIFNDVGRVWHDDEHSRDWHVGNGAGIWLAPIRRFVVTVNATRSKEEKVLPYVTFGFQF